VLNIAREVEQSLKVLFVTSSAAQVLAQLAYLEVKG
jgi:hypothetical protein